MNIFMFPGQGAQCIGMGKDLFDHFPAETALASKILKFDIGNFCTDSSNTKLNETQFTQPCLFVVEALCFKQAIEQGMEPDCCIGHSLGEYSALFAAGVFDFATGLQLVTKRGELMSNAKNGGMLAILNYSENDVLELLEDHKLSSIDIANINSNSQLVVAGPDPDIVTLKSILKNEGVVNVQLKVSGAFHSRYMQDAANQFEQYLANFSFNQPIYPIYANINSRLYKQSNVKANLVKQITSPVLWWQIIAKLKLMGKTNFIEIGPGDTLSKLIK